MRGRVDDSRRNRLTDRKGIEGVVENKKWRKAKGREGGQGVGPGKETIERGWEDSDARGREE